MAKKDFTKSMGSKNLSSLIPTDEPEQETKQGRRVATKKKTSSAKPKPKAKQTTVTTFRINNDSLFAVKALAYWERKKIQEVFDEALTAYFNSIPEKLKKAQSEFKKRQS